MAHFGGKRSRKMSVAHPLLPEMLLESLGVPYPYGQEFGFAAAWALRNPPFIFGDNGLC